MDTKRGPETSIIIPILNEREALKRNLTLIDNQNYKDFEIIVVDSGSTDGTLDLAKKYPVKIIHYQGPVGDKFNYAKALNLGGREAEGKYLVRLSAHAFPYNRNWLNELLGPFFDPLVAGTYSRQIHSPKSGLYHKFLCFLDFSRFHGLFEKLACYTMFYAASCAIRRGVWQEIPFDEKLGHTEDVAWALAVAKKGYKIVYVPKSIVRHSHYKSLGEIMTKRKFWRSLWINTKVYLDGVGFCFSKRLLGIKYGNHC
jgi:rhamnosyltransferase